MIRPRRSRPVALLLALAALLLLAPAAPAGPEEDAAKRAKALGAQLADPDLDVAEKAAKALRAMGADARHAIPALLQALDRRLPAQVRSRIWHEDRATIASLKDVVLRTLVGLGAHARDAIPTFLAVAGAGGSEHRPLVLRVLLAEWPTEKAVVEGLLGHVARGALQPAGDDTPGLRDWLDAQGARAVSAWQSVVERSSSPDMQHAADRLQALGEDGNKALHHIWTHGRDSHKSLLIGTWARAGVLPQIAREETMQRLGWGVETHLVPICRALRRIEPEPSRRLAYFLRKQPFHGPIWKTLWKESPGLAERTSNWVCQGLAIPADNRPFDEQGQRLTAQLGGSGGGAFREAEPAQVLVGLRVTVGRFGWQHVVRSVQAVYLAPDGLRNGPVHGKPDGTPQLVIAPEGHALAGIHVHAPRLVLGFAPIFMKRTAKGLDPKTATVGAWVGSAIVGDRESMVGGRGTRLVGIAGRAGDAIDALGFVEAAPSSD